MVKKLYNNFEEIFCASCMALMVICLCIQVLIRFFAGSSLAWTEELSRYSFIWTVYIGAALVAKHNAHVRITAQFLLTPRKFQLAMRLLADAVWVGFTLFMAWHCWEVLRDGLDFPEISPTLHIVKAYVEIIIPAGFTLMAWRIVEGWLTRWKNGTAYDVLREEGA